MAMPQENVDIAMPDMTNLIKNFYNCQNEPMSKEIQYQVKSHEISLRDGNRPWWNM